MTANISYPRENSLSARCLARFLLGEPVTHREADKASGSYRLASFVHYLEREHGWVFDRAELQEQTLDPTGRKATYMKYWLSKRLIDWAGETGKTFAERVLRIEAEKVAERMAATTQSAETESRQQTHLDNQSSTPDTDCQGHGHGPN
jgi:hypothetical protein